MADGLGVAVLTGGLSLVVGGGGVAWFTAIRSERRESRKDDRDATKDKVDVVGTLITGQLTLMDRVSQASTDAQDARSAAQIAQLDATAARAEATAARAEVTGLRRSFARLVAPLVTWLDAGATPPAPEVSDELRALIRDENT